MAKEELQLAESKKKLRSLLSKEHSFYSQNKELF